MLTLHSHLIALDVFSHCPVIVHRCTFASPFVPSIVVDLVRFRLADEDFDTALSVVNVVVLECLTGRLSKQPRR